MAQLSRTLSTRQRVAQIMSQSATDWPGRAVDLTLMALILISVLAIVLESVEPLRVRHHVFFLRLEMFVVVVFTIEHCVRLWSAADDPKYAHGDGVWRARMRYLMSPLAVIDMAAILPFYLEFFGVLGGGDMLVLRSVRLLRILKLTRYSASFTVLINVIRENVRGLAAAVFLLNVIMLLAAVGIYLFEHEAQPQAFGSIPAAMWWAFATLTTVGYGDVTPITAAGRVFGASITVVGVGMVALPTAILASAFSERLRLRAQRYRDEVDAALDDGVVSGDEAQELESLREELGLGSELAGEIMAAGTTTENAKVRMRAVQPATADTNPAHCPHCHGDLRSPGVVDAGPVATRSASKTA